MIKKGNKKIYMENLPFLPDTYQRTSNYENFINDVKYWTEDAYKDFTGVFYNEERLTDVNPGVANIINYIKWYHVFERPIFDVNSMRANALYRFFIAWWIYQKYKELDKTPIASIPRYDEYNDFRGAYSPKSALYPQYLYYIEAATQISLIKYREIKNNFNTFIVWYYLKISNLLKVEDMPLMGDSTVKEEFYDRNDVYFNMLVYDLFYDITQSRSPQTFQQFNRPPSVDPGKYFVKRRSGRFEPFLRNPLLLRSDMAPSLNNISILRQYEDGFPIEHWGTMHESITGGIVELPRYKEWNPRNTSLYMIRYTKRVKSVDGKYPCTWIRLKKNDVTGELDEDTNIFQKYAYGDQRSTDVGHRLYELKYSMLDFILELDGGLPTLGAMIRAGKNIFEYDNLMQFLYETIFPSHDALYRQTEIALVPHTMIAIMLTSNDDSVFRDTNPPHHIYKNTLWGEIRKFISYVRTAYYTKTGFIKMDIIHCIILTWALWSKFLHPNFNKYNMFNFWYENFSEVS